MAGFVLNEFMKCGLLPAIFLLAAAPAWAAPENLPTRIEIAAMPLRDALVRLARQADISISFGDLPVENYRGGYVIGATTLEEALDQLLRRTPFSYEIGANDTVRLTLRDVSPHNGRSERGANASGWPDDIIIVNSTKRLTDARRLPISVSSISGDDLDLSGVRRAGDLSSRLAGVAFTNLGVSRNKIFVRGLSDGPFADRTQSTVGVYLDETPLILNDTNPDLQMIDLERVELVRGPQGSLYGGGSIGGLLKMVTAKPQLDEVGVKIGAKSDFTDGGEPSAQLESVFNLPLKRDVFGARLSAYRQKLGGFIDDAGLGAKNVNSSTVSGGRLALRYLPDNVFTVDSLVALQRVDTDGAQYVFRDLPGLTRATSLAEPHRDAYNLANVTLTGDLAGASVKSATSYIWRRSDFAFDATAALPDLLAVSGSTGLFSTRDRSKTFFHESRLAADDFAGLKALVGIFFLLRNEKLNSVLDISLDGDQSPFQLTRTDSYKEAALFGETTANVSDSLSITLGGRLAFVDFEADSKSAGVLAVAPGAIERKNSRLFLSPRIAIAKDLSQDTLLFGQISHGSREGGVNISGPLSALFDNDADSMRGVFESDSLWNFETGLKSRFWGGRVNFNASLFYVIWTNMQTDQFLPSGISFIANAGGARNYGLEIESIVRPIDRLELRATAFLNSPELRTANPLLGAAKGDSLPNIAEASAGFSASYAAPLSNKWSWGFDGDLGYVGRSFLTFAGGSAPPMGDYFTLGFQTYVARENLILGIDAENLLNQRGNTFSFGNPFNLPFHDQETPLRPRTIGVFLRKEF